MNISNWPNEKIMQLPDECFGRRWPIISSRTIAVATTVQWLIKASLPDRCILWSVGICGFGINQWNGTIKIALGDNEPATDAEFDAFERIIPGDFQNDLNEGAIYMSWTTLVPLMMRMPLKPQGRRFAVQVYNPAAAQTMFFNIIFTISSIPTDVPIQLCEEYWISYLDLVKQIQKTGIGFNP